MRGVHACQDALRGPFGRLGLFGVQVRCTRALSPNNMEGLESGRSSLSLQVHQDWSRLCMRANIAGQCLH